MSGFFWLSDKRCLICIISNKIISLKIFRGQILLDEMPFFWVFENDNILSSKSYRVTKSGISPQRKVGSFTYKI